MNRTRSSDSLASEAAIRGDRHTIAPRSRRYRRRSRHAHGHPTVRTLKRALGRFSGNPLDGRTTLGKALAAWRCDLLADLGGADAISTQQAALVDLAVRTKLLVDSVDVYVLGMSSPVNKRKRQLFAVVVQRQALVGQLQSLLRDLGLERKARAVPDLASYLAKRGSADGDAGPTPHESAPTTRSETDA
jgi:hypothetical protein